MLSHMAQIFFSQHARIKRGKGNLNFLSNSHSKINENIVWNPNNTTNRSTPPQQTKLTLGGPPSGNFFLIRSCPNCKKKNTEDSDDIFKSSKIRYITKSTKTFSQGRILSKNVPDVLHDLN